MQVILIRHGSTAGNLEHRYVGSTDEPLTGNAMINFKPKSSPAGCVNSNKCLNSYMLPFPFVKYETSCFEIHKSYLVVKTNVPIF